MKSELHFFDNLFDTLPSGILIFKPDGEVVRINQKACELLGLTSIEEPCLLQDFPDHFQELRAVLLSGEAQVHRAEITMQLPGPAQESIIGYSVVPLSNGTPYLVLTCSDITQVVRDRLTLERLQEELHQSKKLASIGTLVAGVAHELNNPLTGISMSATLLKMNLERLMPLAAIQADAQVQASLEKGLVEVGKVIRANEKAGVLVSDLLAYSKPGQLALESLYVNDLIDSMLGALRNHPQFSNVQFTFRNEQKYKILCDRIKLEQVFYNLFKNASEAMGGQGMITISLSQREFKEKPAVVIHIQDQGPGMDTSVMNRIFDPFFTTKGHAGVGLGLSISYRTVEQHNGLLAVSSTPSVGTEFQVMLPVLLDGGEQPQVLC